MTDLTYHVESENRREKNDLSVSIVSIPRSGYSSKQGKESLLSLAKTSGEKSALELLLKGEGPFDKVLVSGDRAFDLLKLLGTTGRVFFREKKVVIDPFTAFNLCFEAMHLSPGRAEFTAHLLLGDTSYPLSRCDFVFVADPSWILQGGIMRAVKPEISEKWMVLASSGKFVLEGTALIKFLDAVEGDVTIDWKGEQKTHDIDPLPLLILADRHGGFADLWFDYGAYGKVAAHDPIHASFRNPKSETGWEKDLLETDFMKKIVDKSHFYCPLDKVAKSLTFLLEIGWVVIDGQGRRVLRQKGVDFDADLTEENIVIKTKVRYEEHEVDLKHLVGAFNRREHFVELSPKTVALIDPLEFQEQWGDLTDQEITREGIALKKNQLGLLQPLLQTLPVKEDLKEKISRLIHCVPNLTTEVGKSFRGVLFPYQTEGLHWLNFLDEQGFGGLLADEMGLGKTVQVLAFFSQLSCSGPILIVVPTSLIFNWQREIEKFLPSFSIYRHEGKERLRTQADLAGKQLILTSYALLRIDAKLLQEIDYQVVILDEAQAIKNPDSQTAQICFTLSARVRLAITGTPIENRLEDLWSLFHFLQPDLLGEKGYFQSQLQAAESNAYHFSKIKKKIRPFLLRRKKEQVSLELPPKLEQTVFIEMTDSQRCAYDRWLKNTKLGLLKKVSLDGAASHRMEILEAILRLRQICAHPWLVEEPQEEDPQESCAKLQRLMSDLQEIVEQKQKVLIYSQFTSMLQLIERCIRQEGWNYVYLDGSTKDREGVVRQFQEEENTSIFLISLKAGGVGLNLTAADYVFLYDPWWNEAAENQAIDRAHRFGQKGTVIARRYVTVLSIEEKIMSLKEHKSALSKNLLESEEGFVPTTIEDLLALLE
jgi:superfamily II DNA or RNA helicase